MCGVLVTGVAQEWLLVCAEPGSTYSSILRINYVQLSYFEVHPMCTAAP